MSDEKRITVSRVIDASAADIFAVLTLPERHHEFDATGTVRTALPGNRLEAVGDVFGMNMHADAQGGDYVMYNHVVAFDQNHLVGWQPCEEERHVGEHEPAGWQWVYTLTPQGPDSTDVTLTYDWSRVTDKNLLHIFPGFQAPELEESLNLLAAAVAS